MLLGNATIALVAGVFSTLSPCVLPLLPIVLATAISEHRLGPLALATGLAVSFVSVGLFIATIGYAIGLDAGFFRALAALLLLTIGVVLLVPQLQTQIASAAAPVSGWADNTFGGFNTGGLTGQFALGLLLGIVWSPCVGPTLGAASVLAAQGKDLGQVTLIMLAFGLGAALPLLLLGLVSQDMLLRWRSQIAGVGKHGKVALGVLLIAVGLAVVSGVDKRFETAVLDTLPSWFTEISTRY
jgi:cytochrome c biogenesis protein CcdA